MSLIWTDEDVDDKSRYVPNEWDNDEPVKVIAKIAAKQKVSNVSKNVSKVVPVNEIPNETLLSKKMRIQAEIEAADEELARELFK